MKQSYFCNFDIKNESLDPENPHVAICRHQIASEIALQHYLIFETREQNLSLAAENSNCNNLKTS